MMAKIAGFALAVFLTLAAMIAVVPSVPTAWVPVLLAIALTALIVLGIVVFT